MFTVPLDTINAKLWHYITDMNKNHEPFRYFQKPPNNPNYSCISFMSGKIWNNLTLWQKITEMMFFYHCESTLSPSTWHTHTKILCWNRVVEIFEALHVDDRQSIIHNAPGKKNKSLKTKVINIQISLRDEPALNLHTEISRIIQNTWIFNKYFPVRC